MGIGRLGCYFTSCCAGRAARSRWRVWCSDRSVRMRRVPTQLLESALALMTDLGVVAVLAVIEPVRGALFVIVLALYTLIRQGLLRFRAGRFRHGARSEWSWAGVRPSTMPSCGDDLPPRAQVVVSRGASGPGHADGLWNGIETADALAAAR